MPLIDTAGSLELSDTGRRCTTVTEDGEIVRIHCATCGDTQVLGKNLAAIVWASMKTNGGWHLGCADPAARARHATVYWHLGNADPAARARHATVYEEIEKQSTTPPPGACPICDQLDCGGAAT